MTKWKGHTASMAPATLSISFVALVATGAAHAQAVEITDARAEIQTITDDVDITVAATGSVIVDTDDQASILVDVADYTQAFVNDGFVAHDGQDTQDTTVGVIRFAGNVSGTVENNNSIAADVTTVPSVAGIDVAGTLSGSIDNAGAITVENNLQSTATTSAAVVASGVQTSSVAAGGLLSNNGTIDAAATVDIDPNLNASQGLFSATAYGINAGTVAGTIQNNGIVNVNADVTLFERNADVNVGAIGVVADGDGGDFAGDGAITVNASFDGTGTTGDIDIDAIGLVLTGDFASVTNSGAITVSASVEGTNSASIQANATGIEVDDISADDSFANSGDIDVSLSGQVNVNDTFDAQAVGISAGTVDGSFTNSGAVDVTVSLAGDVTASDFEADATGLAVAQIGDTGSFVNSGDIDVSLSVQADTVGDYTGDAIGLRTGTVDGSFINSGAIDVAISLVGQTTDDTVEASAIGLDVGTVGETGNFVNSGAIDVSLSIQGDAIDGFSADVLGLDATSVDGSFTNSGDIALATIVAGDSTSGRINLESKGINPGGINGTFLNTGNINIGLSQSGDASSGIFVEACGIEVLSVDGGFENDGDISISATAAGNAGANVSNASMLASAQGLIFEDIVSGTVTNTGTITVSADASGTAAAGAAVFATGADFTTLDGTFDNTGDIVVTADVQNADASASATAEAVAIDIDVLNGTLTSTKALIAQSDTGDAFALRVGGGTGEVVLDTTSVFAGQLSLQNEALTVRSVEDGGDIFWTFNEGEIPATVTLEDAGGAILVQDGNVIATVSAPSDAAQTADGVVAAEVITLGSEAALNVLRGNASDTGLATRAHTNGGGASGITTFAEADFVSREFDDLSFDATAITGGVNGSIASGFDYAVAITGSQANGQISTALGASDVSSNGFAISAYGSAGYGDITFAYGATFGSATNESTRLVNDNTVTNGVMELDAAYDASYISPAFEVSYATQIGTASVTPRIGYRYTQLTAEGYDETGGAAAASVGERTSDISDFTIGADAAMVLGQSVLTGSADVLMRQTNGDDFDVTFLGATDDFAGASSDFTSVDLGVGYEMQLGDGIVSVAASGMFGDVTGYGLAAHYKMSF